MFFCSWNLLWIHMFKCFKLLFLSLVVYLLTSLPRIYTILLVGFLVHPSILKSWVAQTLFFSPFTAEKKGKGGTSSLWNLHVVKLGRWWNCRIPSSETRSELRASRKNNRPRFKVTKRLSTVWDIGRLMTKFRYLIYLFAPPKKLNPHNESNYCCFSWLFQQWHGKFASRWINDTLVDQWNTSKEQSYSVHICCWKYKYHIKYV